MGFIELNRRLDELNGGLFINFIEESLNELKSDITKFNQNQLADGHKASGEFLPNYSPRTTQISPNKTGRIKLYDTGDFWKSIFSFSGSGIFEVDATDWKTEMLKSRYGDEILGMDEQNMRSLLNKLAEILKVKVGNFLQQ